MSFSLSLLRLSRSVGPILSGVRPPDLQIERKKEATRERKKGFYHSFLFLSPFSPSLSLLGANNYSFLCHQLEQSTPLSQSLSPCICVHAWAFAAFLTIIRSTQADSRSLGTSVGRSGAAAECQRVCRHMVMRTTPIPNLINQLICVLHFIFMNIHRLKSREDLGGYHFLWYVRAAHTHTHTGTYDYRHVNMVKNA